MPLSNSVIRRYTPPTCTLEVLAQSSPLSRWMGKTVLKQLSFELHFDDPRLPEERRLPIRGDRDQLEALCDAVSSYVQNFLQQPPESFWLSFSEPEDSSKVTDGAEFTAVHNPSLSANTQTLKSFSSHLPRTTIYLEPSTYLTHNLFLGSLANHSTGPVIQLSLLQLFDLATALDEYSADVMALPTLNNTTSSFTWPAWTSVAAVLVLGVGLLPLTWQYVNSNAKTKQPQIAQKSAPAPEKIALEPSASLNIPTPQPGLTPPDNLQFAKNSNPSLLSQPILGSTPPPPNGSLPTVPLTAPSFDLSRTTPKLPKTPVSIATPKLPISNFPIASSTSPSLPTLPQGTNPIFSGTPQQNIPAPTTIGSPPISIQPNPPQNTTASVPPGNYGLPKRRNLPQSLSPETSTPPNPPKDSPFLGTIPNPPKLALSPGKTPEISPGINNSSPVSEGISLADQLRSASQPPSSTEVSTNSLFDTPQLAEAREYFQKRWQPPTGFAQTLEYSLTLGVDGTIEAILPLNKAARDYVDMAGMPNIGKPFVSGNRYGKNVRIRAVFSPEGKVQIFPETE